MDMFIFVHIVIPERVEFHIRDIVGFGTDNQGYVVVVDECPKCFERSYHHLYDFDTYDIFLMIRQTSKISK